jgi:3-oxoadipate CoA-transferase, alpha subunit
MIDKTVRSVADALADVRDGATVLVAGFAGVGEPRALVEGLIEQGAKNLTVVQNAAGRDTGSVGRLVALGRVRKLIVSFVSRAYAKAVQERYADGRLELEMVPQGTIAERVRAGGAGVPAFYTRTSVGTLLAEGKEARAFAGETYVLERAIHGDVALVEAWEADRWGNLTYRASGNNFNGVMAMAADLTIAQSQHVRELGTLDPERIHTAGIFVNRVVHVLCGDPPE